MHRNALEGWLDRHPDSISTPSRPLMDRCEAEIRNHAEVVAWKHALRIATTNLRRFDGRFGLPASETFVTREVCHEIARDLKRHEPHLERIDESEWLSRGTLDSLDPEARSMFRDWVRELAEKEEHRVWREIVAFTHHVAHTLIDKAHMTGRLEWDLERSYPRIAMQVMQMLLREYAIHLRDSRREVSKGSLLH